MKVLEAISQITRHTISLSQLAFHFDLGIFYSQIDIKKKKPSISYQKINRIFGSDLTTLIQTLHKRWHNVGH